MIAGRIAGPAAALDVLKKPRAEAPGNARQFGLRLHHEYFGRYMIFGFLALLQGTLVCLGDMFYLGVQCEHPIQFLMVGWLSALVFSNIVYTLTLSFGDIGKAIAVVLLVMQVAGSGGTFPIETLPTFFQVVSKWLLFPYAWMRCIRPWQAHSAWNTGFPWANWHCSLSPHCCWDLCCASR